MGEKEQGTPGDAGARASGYMKYPGIAEEGGEEGARASGYLKYGGVAGERWKGATGWEGGPGDAGPMEGKSVKGSKSNTSE